MGECMKVGDKVKAITKIGSGTHVIGEIGEITGNDNSEILPICVKWDSGKIEWCNENELELIPEYDVTLIAGQPNEKLFTAAVAAMQGLLSSPTGISLGIAKKIMGCEPPEDFMLSIKWWHDAESKYCFMKAEALINEGKKRGHI